MAIENCISDCDGRISEPHRCPEKPQRISSEANMTISGLGTDLLVEILMRLPNPRSVCHCKLVCKRWNSLISNPPFNRRFVSHHQTRNHPHMPVDPYKLKSFILSLLPPMPCRVRNNLRVLDCNNDLVLCGFGDVDCDDGERGRSYLVCNPFTKQWIALPLAPRKHVGYMVTAARIVCEPRNFNKLDLGGEDQAAFVFSEYRFRVVCIYQVVLPQVAIKLDVFCSESGQWTKEALVCISRVRTPGSRTVISCNGELFWKYDIVIAARNLVAVFNPFRLDMPPTSIDASAFRVYPRWFISRSQGVLHVIALENETVPVRTSIWRLEEDRKSWRKQCEGLVNNTSKCCNYEVEGCYRPFLHPQKPEIVFFNPLRSEEKNALLCCNLRTDEVEFFAKVQGKPDFFYLEVFQPRISCWPTPIPRYDELRGMYDGSCSFWVQSSVESITHSPPSLNICKDEVMKSASYKDYIECLIEEANRDIAAEIIKRRKNKISEIVRRERQLPRFPFDKELDEVETVLEDIGDEVVVVGKMKENLKKRLRMCKTSAELSNPPDPVIRNLAVLFRKRRRRGMVFLRGMVKTERKQPRFADDKEAGFKDVVSYVAAVDKPEQLEQGLLCGTCAEVPDHLVSIKSVSAEATTTNMVAPSRKHKLCRMVITEGKQPRFADDEEAGFKDVVSYVAAVGKPKELEQGLLCETSAELPYHTGTVKSVCAEVTRDIVAEIKQRKNKISEFLLRERQQPRLPNNKLEDLKDVESYIAAIGNSEQLKQGVLCETSAEVPHPLVPIKRPSLLVQLVAPPFEGAIMPVETQSTEDWEKSMLVLLGREW